MNLTKLSEAMEKMPALRHAYEGYEGTGDFDMMKSEVIQWLAKCPEILEFAMEQMQRRECLVYDRDTGKWSGARGNFKNTPFTEAQMMGALGAEQISMYEWLAVANVKFEWECGQFNFRKAVFVLVAKGIVVREGSSYRAATTPRKPGAPRSPGGLALVLADFLEVLGPPVDGDIVGVREWMKRVTKRTGVKWSKASFYSKIQRLIQTGHVTRIKEGEYFRVKPAEEGVAAKPAETAPPES